MGFINNMFKKKDKEARGFFESLHYSSNGNYVSSKAMLLPAVYRCVEVISDSVAQLPLEPYIVDEKGYKKRFLQHPSYRLLHLEPNSRMTTYTFLKTMVTSMLLTGNAFAYIKRDSKGNAVGLHYIPSELVTINDSIVDTFNPIKYSVVGIKGMVEACNMIHLLNFSYDGIVGVSTLTHAANTLGISADSESHARGFFKGGANVAGILKVQSALNAKQKNDLKTAWQSAFNANTGEPNGVAVLEGNMDFQPITVNPKDAQMLETREFNVIDVCRFFGVSPNKCFDLSKSSYSTVEATQLAFLTDTLGPLIRKIEQEFEKKLYKPSEKEHVEVKFDTSQLLRADKTALSGYYRELFNIGVITPNEIRKELNLPAIEGGDNTFLQVNITTLENAIKAPVVEKEELIDNNALSESKSE
jgi:HK97 family phage portal protein